MYRRRPSWSPVHRTDRRCRRPPAGHRPLPAHRPRSYSLRMPRRHCNLLPCHSQGQDCRSRRAVYPPAPQRLRCPHCQRLNRRRFRSRRHSAHPFRRRRHQWIHHRSTRHRPMSRHPMSRRQTYRHRTIRHRTIRRSNRRQQAQKRPSLVATLCLGPCSRRASRMPRRSRGLARAVSDSWSSPRRTPAQASVGVGSVLQTLRAALPDGSPASPQEQQSACPSGRGRVLALEEFAQLGGQSIAGSTLYARDER